MYTLDKHIILLGFMGCGKSTIGKILSEKLQLPFYDLDKLIEKDSKLKVEEIFEQKGESTFRGIETSVLKSSMKLLPGVIALGGGTPCFEANHKYIFNQNDITVYLDYSHVVLAARLLKSKNKRPLISQYQDEDSLSTYVSTLLENRKTHYEKADLIIKNPQTKEIIIETILNYLKYISSNDQ